MKISSKFLFIVFSGVAMNSFASEKTLTPSHGVAYPKG